MPICGAEAVLRRTQMIPFKGSHDNAVNPRLTIDFVNQRVKVDDRPVKLTPVQYRLLAVLAKNRDTVVPYRTIVEEVWGDEQTVGTANIRSSISRLRRKLHDDPPRMILNSQGAGYVLKS